MNLLCTICGSESPLREIRLGSRGIFVCDNCASGVRALGAEARTLSIALLRRELTRRAPELFGMAQIAYQAIRGLRDVFKEQAR